MSGSGIRLTATVLGVPDPQALAGFYEGLLGWSRDHNDPDWVTLPDPAGGAGLSFQRESEHVPPVWPPQDGAQQMMAHLDVQVDDLQAASEHAIALGATLSEHQPQDRVLVHLDPAGHPFCLYLPGA